MDWLPLVLDPAGANARQIATLTWLLIAVVGIVFLLVCAALAVSIFGKARWKARLARYSTILALGFAFPVAVLAGLLAYSLLMTRGLSAGADEVHMRVRVTGEMWWWRVAYLDEQSREIMTDANELHIPAGRTIAIELHAADVIHSFWIPQLGGKEDMIPGRVNVLHLGAERPGVYAGQCAEFCGGPHALMGFKVIAHEEQDFEAWLRRRQRDPAPPQDELSRRGAELVMTLGCAACHQIRGTAANGQAGPDLTYVGARQSLGAGILPNNRGTLAGWVAQSQTIKPGNRMPNYGTLPAQDLQAVAAYLEQLK
jgi:cytochrome c oxidase subunit 2